MKRLCLAAALLAAACTYNTGEPMNGSQFHPPFTYQPWQVEHADGACIVTSGYSGISVEVRGREMAVKSNRTLDPGTIFSVNAGGSHFETTDEYFPAQTAPKLVDALSHGGKAYLEWSEIQITGGTVRIRTQNIVKLEDFPAKLRECAAAPKSKR